jgi:hypothetical protein
VVRGLRERPLAHQEDKSQTGDHSYCDRKRETKLFHDAHGSAPRKTSPPPYPPRWLWRGLSGGLGLGFWAGASRATATNSLTRMGHAAVCAWLPRRIRMVNFGEVLCEQHTRKAPAKGLAGALLCSDDVMEAQPS